MKDIMGDIMGVNSLDSYTLTRQIMALAACGVLANARDPKLDGGSVSDVSSVEMVRKLVKDYAASQKRIDHLLKMVERAWDLIDRTGDIALDWDTRWKTDLEQWQYDARNEGVWPCV